MKKIIFFALILISPNIFAATLTTNTVPYVCQGGTNPQLCNSSTTLDDNGNVNVTGNLNVTGNITASNLGTKFTEVASGVITGTGIVDTINVGTNSGLIFVSASGGGGSYTCGRYYIFTGTSSNSKIWISQIAGNANGFDGIDRVDVQLQQSSTQHAFDVNVTSASSSGGMHYDVYLMSFTSE